MLSSNIPQSFLQFISKWEGGYSDTPGDKGGITNRGWSKDTFEYLLPLGIKAKFIDPSYYFKDFNPMPNQLFTQLHNYYWWLNQLNYIKDKKLACLIYEYILGAPSTYLHVLKVFNKYFKTSFKMPNKLDFMKLNELNNADQNKLYQDLLTERLTFLNDIVKNDPTQSKFLVGWINRLKDFANNLHIESGAISILPIALLLLYITTK
jgi:hypothetical protein